MVEREIREIFGQLRNLLEVHEEIGLELPPLTGSRREYLEGRGARPVQDPGAPQNPASLEALRGFIGDCRRCKLHSRRTNLVFGEGAPRAELLFVGEGPGQEEDRQGRPFVGEAGGLLTRIIEKGMGLRREDVYICNVVKCRPPGNRDPEKDEIETCLPFLRQQIRIVGPKVLCTLGAIAGRALLGEGFRISQARGKWQAFEGIPLMPTYHPAYLLRYPAAKRKVWEDVQEIMRRLGLEVRSNEKG